MRKADVQKLPHGVYRIHWRSPAGISLAAVGSTHDGTRWMAPTNWVSADNESPKIATTKYWRAVERAELITSE